MNEWEFNEPDEEEAEQNDWETKYRIKRLVESVQTFAPEFKEFNKMREILWWGSVKY